MSVLNDLKVGDNFHVVGGIYRKTDHFVVIGNRKYITCDYMGFLDIYDRLVPDTNVVRLTNKFPASLECKTLDMGKIIVNPLYEVADERSSQQVS